VIEWIDKYITPNLEGRIVIPYAHKVACYYGCLLVRPHKVLNYDRPEDPQSMDLVMSKIGAEPIYYPFKTECCGAGLSISRTDIVSKLSGKIIEDAESRGAEAIIVACPMCHSNLDMRRNDINKYWGKEFKIPVIFITQAIGHAIGLTDKKIGLKRHFVDVKIS
jgi:heterodisulfide reductase subunit B